MAFKQIRDSLTNIPVEVKDLTESYFEYYKLFLFKKIAKLASLVFQTFVIALCVLLLTFFFAIAGAFALGEMIGSYAIGFACIGLFFLLLIVIVFLLRKQLIDRPLLSVLSEFYFDADAESDKQLIERESKNV